MTTGTQYVLLIALGIGLATGVRAAEPYLVQVPATIDPKAQIDDAVRSECGLELVLGNHVLRQVSRKFPGSAQVQKVNDTENGKVLNLTIVAVSGAGGTNLTGAKSMTVQVDVVQAGKVIATIVETRDWKGGMLGAAKDRCSILEGVAVILATDIAKWLAGGPYLVQVPATLDPKAQIDDAVRSECGLELLLGNHALRQVSKKFPGSAQIQKVDDTEKGKVLKLTILAVSGLGGTSWTGPKSMTVQVDVVQAGKVIATTVETRDSIGGMWGAVKGRCSILERVAVILATDIAKWLPGTMIAPAAAAPASATPSPAAALEKKAD